MALRAVFAIICVLSLLIELSFDCTNPFVRVSLAPAQAATLELKANSSATSGTDKSLINRTADDDDRSLGHYSVPASDFVFITVYSFTRFHADVRHHYRYIERFVLLRPPIHS